MRVDARAERNLLGVHPDLIRIVRTCAETCPVLFTITEGIRTKERQAKLFAAGASKTMNSRHLTGHAVDVAALVDFDGDGTTEIRWDWPLYFRIAGHMKDAAFALKIPLTWGGDWTSLKDGPHYELPHKDYPA